MAANPIPIPTMTRPHKRTYLLGDTPITTAPTVNTKDAVNRTGLRPKKSVNGPAKMADIAAAAIVTLTISSCQTGFNENDSSIFNIAPDTTPVSYPNKNPPTGKKIQHIL